MKKLMSWTFFFPCFIIISKLNKPDPPNLAWSMPDWLKTSADHMDEIPFVFGGPLIRRDMEKNNTWQS